LIDDFIRTVSISTILSATILP